MIRGKPQANPHGLQYWSPGEPLPSAAPIIENPLVHIESPPTSGLLTKRERECLHLLGELQRLVKDITFTKDNPYDWREAGSAIHVLQNMVMSQAAARAYPGEYRLLGEALNRSTPHGGRSDQTSKEE